jgi:hypothetical protein
VSLSNHTITENTTNTILGTLSATDADVEDAFVYTLKNNSAASYGGFNFDGVGFCVAFIISVDAVEI